MTCLGRYHYMPVVRIDGPESSRAVSYIFMHVAFRIHVGDLE